MLFPNQYKNVDIYHADILWSSQFRRWVKPTDTFIGNFGVLAACDVINHNILVIIWWQANNATPKTTQWKYRNVEVGQAVG